MRRAASWLNDPGSPWMATFTGSKLTGWPGGKQIFFEQKRVNSGRIIMPKHIDYVVIMAFVEAERGGIIHGSFKSNGAALCGTQMMLS